MTKTEVEALLEEFDEALVQAFPGPEPMSVLLVGGACFLLQGITTQSTDSVDVIIVEMVGSKERTLVFHSPTADKIRRIIRAIGNRAQAQQIVDRYFPSPAQQAMYRLPCTLERVFGK